MVRSRPVRPLCRRLAAVAAAVATLVAVGGTPAARGEDPSQQTQALRDRDASLAAQARSAELELYALETRLDAARTRVAALESRRAAVAEERRLVGRRLQVARQTLRAAERLLSERLRLLYEEGRTDPLEILLGADSLEDALSDLDGLEFAAHQDREIIERTLVARRRLTALLGRLDAQSSRLAGLHEAAAAEAAAVAQARLERESFLNVLLAQRQANAQRIGALQARVAAARTRTARVAVDQPAAAPVAAPPSRAAASPGGSTLTVVATGYALPGRTATGIPVGWGVVAVDPSVIPLGTRMTIPGYGSGVAADVGSAVRGAKIDLWFPSLRQALGWGTRTVTITIH